MKISYLAGLILATLLSGCGGSNAKNDMDTETPAKPEPSEPVVQEGQIFGPFSTGSSSEPKSVYFDLEAGTVLELTNEQAASDSRWDIAFNRTKVALNNHVDNSVGMYFTAVNSDFFDDKGAAIADKFLTATADSELTDYQEVNSVDVPADEAFTGDVAENIIGAKFYNYDMSTHVVSAADDKYFIVSSDGAYTKFRVKSLTSAGRTMSYITLGIQHQSTLDGATEFAAESDLVVDTSVCSDNIYIDFDLAASLSINDAWDITLSCVTIANVTGADFAIHIAPDATAFVDSDNSYSGIDSQSAPYYDFQSDVTQQLAFNSAPWYQYNLNGGHLLWSQYGVYLIKTNTATYKVQITSYYDEAGTSGNYSFRFNPLITK